MEHLKFVEEINQFLNRTGMLKTDLARRLDMDYKTIYRWLSRGEIANKVSMNHVLLFMTTYKPSRIKAKGANAKLSK